MRAKAQPNDDTRDERQSDQELDEALEGTFPASDPIEPEQPGGEPERR